VYLSLQATRLQGAKILRRGGVCISTSANRGGKDLLERALEEKRA